jgi:hypothetical protein
VRTQPCQKLGCRGVVRASCSQALYFYCPLSALGQLRLAV